MRLYPSLTVDGEFKALRDAGYTGSLNDMQFAFLRSEGYSGALGDMQYQFTGGDVPGPGPGSENTWTMTAGTNVGIGYSSGTNIAAMGSISNEPVSGLTLTTQVSEGSASSSTRLGFEGDVVSQVSGFTELVVDGAVFTINTWDTFSFIGPLFTRANFSGNGPTYVEGNTYSCELR